MGHLDDDTRLFHGQPVHVHRAANQRRGLEAVLVRQEMERALGDLPEMTVPDTTRIGRFDGKTILHQLNCQRTTERRVLPEAQTRAAHDTSGASPQSTPES